MAVRPRQTVCNRRKRWERFVGLQLIPVGRARQAIVPIVVMAVFDGDPDLLAKVDWIFNVEAVERRLPAPVRPAGQGEAVVGTVILDGGTIGGVEIVFGAGAVRFRPAPPVRPASAPGR